MDPTSLDPAVRSQIREENYKLKRSNGLRIGVPTEHNISELEPDVRRAWIKALQLLEHLGHSIHHVSLPSTKIALSAYYVIAPAEASSNLAKYDGVRYGNQSNSPCEPEGVLYASTRGNQLGEEVKRRILLGAYSLSASAIDNYFLQAQRVRRLVQQDFDAVFRRSNPLSNSAPRTQKTGVDVLLAPTATSLPPSLDSLSKGSVIDTYKDDVLTVPASLAGLPAMSVPVGRSVEDTSSLSESLDLPELPKSLIGLQIIAQYGDDDLVFHVAQLFDEHGRLGSAAG
jgi:aspartyl-tRNA(Asn)/glutamyl-tRNA(Gln) amidotransferase subunit A